MSAVITEQTVNMLEIVKEEEIAAPMDVVFETILEQMGPLNEREPGEPMPMKLEAWPGGRWFRDLGNGAGHWWGTVQAIKAPSLIEIYGPLFMSYPASLECAVQAEGRERRDEAQVYASRDGVDCV